MVWIHIIYIYIYIYIFSIYIYIQYIYIQYIYIHTHSVYIYIHMLYVYLSTCDDDPCWQEKKGWVEATDHHQAFYSSLGWNHIIVWGCLRQGQKPKRRIHNWLGSWMKKKNIHMSATRNHGGCCTHFFFESWPFLNVSSRESLPWGESKVSVQCVQDLTTAVSANVGKTMS